MQGQIEPLLCGDRVRVRLGTLDDIPQIINFYSANAGYFLEFASPKAAEFYTASFWTKQINSAIANFNEDKTVNLFIFDKAAPATVIGYINFFAIIRGRFHACYLGYGLGQDFVGKGLMLEALTLAIDFVFSARNLHRIMANHAPTNTRSAKVLRRLGFAAEGYARDYLHVNGAWQDHVMTALTNHKWHDPDKDK
jgi:[ribosomal protein S5]-alanine N-acetyltransferase